MEGSVEHEIAQAICVSLSDVSYITGQPLVIDMADIQWG